MMQNRGGSGRGRNRQTAANGGARHAGGQEFRGNRNSRPSSGYGHGRTKDGGRYPSDRPAQNGRYDGRAGRPQRDGENSAENRKPGKTYAGKVSGDGERKNSRPPYAGAAAGNAGSRKPGKTYAGKTPGDGEHRSGRPSYAGREDGERRKPRPPYAAKAGGDGEHRKPSRPYAGKSSGDSERRSSRPPFAGKPAAEGENRNPGKPYAGKRPAGTNLRRPDPLRRREPEVKEVHFVQHPAVVTVRPNPDHVSFGRNVASGCLVIGVTGGIGAGKSEVLRILQEKYGAAVIRSDEVAKELMKKGGPAYPFYREILGEGILGPDGEVDSSRASGLLFADPGKVRRLNEAVHPLVKEEIKNRVEALKKSGKDLIAIESALLAEGGLNDLTDTVWFVDTPEEIRIKRLQDSRGYTEEHCRSVMSRQRTVQQYRREADLVIHNEGIPVDLEDQVSSAMHQYRRRFTAR